ncbi:hypothetical protein P7D93_20185, partial [Enterococcus raffinosus]|nr:hypothetical protein [Enterococcus raffinosus]MDT2557129.1 hypothetical protein [Enterococcus raffinosus]
MTLKIDNAIEEIERALAGNKPKYANDIYLKNAIRYLQEIKSPSLTDDQQVVLEWLKEQVSIGSALQYVLWEFIDNVYEEPATYSVSEQTKAWLELTEQ